MTKDGLRKPNYWGSLTQAATVRVGNYEGEEVYTPFNRLLPMAHPNDLVLGGWDISGLNMAEAMERAKVGAGGAYEWRARMCMRGCHQKSKRHPSQRQQQWRRQQLQALAAVPAAAAAREAARPGSQARQQPGQQAPKWQLVIEQKPNKWQLQKSQAGCTCQLMLTAWQVLA
jgi:hypothetical protein